MTGREAPHSRLSPAKHARSAASVSAPAGQLVGPAPPLTLATIRVMAFDKQDGQPLKALEAASR
jgi:hypothetical protein